MGWETKATTTAVSQQEKHGKEGWTGSYLSHHTLLHSPSDNNEKYKDCSKSNKTKSIIFKVEK